jgi:hypothetical protein
MGLLVDVEPATRSRCWIRSREVLSRRAPFESVPCARSSSGRRATRRIESAVARKARVGAPAGCQSETRIVDTLTFARSSRGRGDRRAACQRLLHLSWTWLSDRPPLGVARAGEGLDRHRGRCQTIPRSTLCLKVTFVTSTRQVTPRRQASGLRSWKQPPLRFWRRADRSNLTAHQLFLAARARSRTPVTSSPCSGMR